MANIPQRIIHDFLRHDKKFPHVWCAGCSNGIVLGSIIRALAGMDIKRDDIVMVSGIGCSSRMPVYVDFNTLHTLHGRSIAYATGIKLQKPHLKVIVITGDGDCTAIGGNHLIHAARSNIDLTVILVNNNIYGMTGGQMAPTTLPDMKTTTSPYGRNVDDIGYPIRVCELLATLVAPYYIERVSLLSPAEIIKAKKAVDKAIRYNKEGRGFTFVEFVSTCPTNWGFDPVKSREWARENMLPFFKPAVFRDKGEGVE